MNQRALLLGLFSIGGQVLLLRELISSLNGDELFIGTALFGWLVAVALGAFGIGRLRRARYSSYLFLAGALLLPIMIVVTRLTPMLITDTIGETIPFTTAAGLSTILMFPVAIISGALFTVIANSGLFGDESVIQVYLYEGIGAFIGGVSISLIVGGVFSTLGVALALSLTIIGCLAFSARRKAGFLVVAVWIVLLASIWHYSPRLDSYLDTVRYTGYNVEHSFDTHYSHQSILTRDSTVVLLTDNTVEKVHPDVQTAESIILPPLILKPDSRDVLLFGRAELGVAEIARQILNLNLVTVDPRDRLADYLTDMVPLTNPPPVIVNDPVKFVAASDSTYDVIIVNTGELDNYRNSRLLTPEFLSRARQLLSPGGLIVVPTLYDTERYVSPQVRDILSVVHSTLSGTFTDVSVWPGNQTIFFASNTDIAFDSDSIPSRLSNIAYGPVYFDEYHLRDRLNEFRRNRLDSTLAIQTAINTLDQPILPIYQAVYRAGATGSGTPFLINSNTLLLVLPCALTGLFVLLLVPRKASYRFAHYLYITAGIVSLSLELVSFYLYQSMAGSLYAELAALVGSFMLGLALGTYISSRGKSDKLALMSLGMLLSATVLFALTYSGVHPDITLVYHMLFQFTVAIATGSLFVAATRQYYLSGSDKNRGAGYAAELAGSSIGALCATTIILPSIGLYWMLFSLCMLILLAGLGTIISTRKI